MAEEGEVLVRRRRWPRWLGLAALVLGLIVLGLWIARKPIAQGQVDSYLSNANVPTRYTISDLGLGRQRLTNVVIGDPANPDLVADWLETRTSWGLRGPTLASISGGHVRVRARWVDGQLSLGSIDRLLPKGDAGTPFALPALGLDVQDLRARVETPWGMVGAKLAGSGRLDGGFDGRLAVVAPALAVGGCALMGTRAAWRVRTAAGAPALAGPARFDRLTCGVTHVDAGGTDVDVKLGRTLADWRGSARVVADRLAMPDVALTGGGGRILFSGDAHATGGTVDLTVQHFVAADLSGERARLTARYVVGGGNARLDDATLHLPRSRAVVSLVVQGAEATPAGPLLDALTRATGAATRSFGLGIRFSASVAGGRGEVAVGGMVADAASGATAVLTESTTRYRWPDGNVQLGGRLAIGGGGMPDLDIAFAQAGSGAPVAGVATLRRPFAAPGASLALTPVRFSVAAGRAVAVRTVLTLSGPLGDGRVEALTLPIDALWRGGAATLSGGCAPVRWTSIAVAGLRLDPGTLDLCPEGGAFVTSAGGRIGGGARIGAARLTGAIGSTPLTLAAAGGRVGLGDRGFAIEGIEAQIGPSARLTRLSVGTLDGRLGPGGIAGRFTGAGGQIANVPLAMSAAAGAWRFAGGALTVDGGLTVADPATPARFQPLAARAVTLQLAGSRITAAGVLHEPATGTKVADVAIVHDLAAGRGTANLTVADLSFVKGFQPDQLTRLTFGVIADVRGTVSGEGHIAWTPAGVTSTGTFRTAGTDLAAAFGPVTGIAGELAFTDLLQLRSAPGQRFTVKSINPGVPVTDGVLTFQTLPGAEVRVEGARWPFAGGALTLDPTLLDFSATARRRLTFRVTGAAADKFLQSFDFKNLDATGTFDGVLPMVFDTDGGRIEDGRLTVREGGGTIAYVGDISRKNLGFWGNFAFDALKSLRYRSLAIVMNGPLAGEMVTEVRFAGIGQGKGAKSNFILRRLQRLPLVFNIRIRAPFRGLLDTTASFYDPRRLIERNLPELIERQNSQAHEAIQPPASETMP